eukprot:jgi/Psemu1/305601/fgenesh1_kg.208_\
MDWIRTLDWTGLDWTGLDWIGLDWIELNQNDSTIRHDTTRHCTVRHPNNTEYATTRNEKKKHPSIHSFIRPCHSSNRIESIESNDQECMHACILCVRACVRERYPCASAMPLRWYWIDIVMTPIIIYCIDPSEHFHQTR